MGICGYKSIVDFITGNTLDVTYFTNEEIKK